MTIEFSGSLLVSSANDRHVAPLLTTSMPLSFWGGIDPLTGEVCDTTHPLYGVSVKDTIFCLPSGRGSSTASQVLLELILNRKAPKALVLRDVDGLICVGALVAQEVFDTEGSSVQVPDIICLGTDQYNALLQYQGGSDMFAKVTSRGNIVVGDSIADVMAGSKEGISTVISPRKNLPRLTKEEEAMLDAANTDAQRMALWVLIRYAHIVSPDDNPQYVGIECAHIDGCTYIGPGGLELAKRLVDAGGKVKVPTTLNAVSCDRKRWQQLGVPQEYAHNSLALGDAYVALGCQPSFTCAPYLLLSDHSLQEKDICWGESNAVVYANTVLGARTEKYADYLDICAALVGKTVATGVHVTEQRRPQIVLDATQVLDDIFNDTEQEEIDSLFPVLGHLCGTLSDGVVPILLGFHTSWNISNDQLKAFCAAYGTTGTSPLIHLANITPEAQEASIVQEYLQTCERPSRTITMHDLMETYTTLDSSSQSESVDLIALGNPHLSISECKTLSELVKDSSKNESVRIMACMSRELYAKADVSKLEKFGVEFINDTCWCMLLDPPVIPSRTDGTIMTNSGKYAHYGPGLTQRKFRFGSLQDCVKTAVDGTFQTKSFPQWLSRRMVSTFVRRSKR